MLPSFRVSAFCAYSTKSEASEIELAGTGESLLSPGEQLVLTVEEADRPVVELERPVLELAGAVLELVDRGVLLGDRRLGVLDVVLVLDLATDGHPGQLVEQLEAVPPGRLGPVDQLAGLEPVAQVPDLLLEAADLVERTRIATERAIKAVKPGRELNVIGRVIESYANRFGYNVVRDFTGHGIGETFHNGLVVLHYDEPNVDTVIEPGMVFTIEPMINLGGLPWEMWDDGWTVVTADRRWTAQFEHTLVVTDDGAEILTLPDS